MFHGSKIFCAFFDISNTLNLHFRKGPIQGSVKKVRAPLASTICLNNNLTEYSDHSCQETFRGRNEETKHQTEGRVDNNKHNLYTKHDTEEFSQKFQQHPLPLHTSLLVLSNLHFVVVINLHIQVSNRWTDYPFTFS